MSMARENDDHITIRVPTEMKRQLKLLCISMSKQQGKVIGISEFIKGLVEPFVKIEKQTTFINKKRNNDIKVL
jgi:hypothetical protein